MYYLEQKHAQVIIYIKHQYFSPKLINLYLKYFIFYIIWSKSINLDHLINRSLKLLIEKKTLDILVLLLPRLSNISILSVPDAKNSRNVQCALNE